MATWRVTQGVYRFDPDLYAPLITTPITNIPGELLRRMPAWCVYVETPGMTIPLIGGGESPLHGVFAWLDWLRQRDQDILTLGLDSDAQFAIGHVPLVGALDAALEQVAADWQAAADSGAATNRPPADYVEQARRTFGPILSLLLYLCSDRTDMPAHPHLPRPKRTKAGWRMFQADNVSTWEVGTRLGAALRTALQAADNAPPEIDPQTGRARPRPHTRKPHWHWYPIGKNRAEGWRHHWLPPIAVNINFGEITTTIKRVRG